MSRCRSLRRAAVPFAVATLTALAHPQQTLLQELGDVQLSGRALRALERRGEAGAVDRLVDAYAATPNSQAGLTQRRRAVAAMEQITDDDATSGATIDGLVDELDDTDDARRIEAILVALGVLVPRSFDRAACERATRAAEEHALRLWHSDEARWTAGEPSTPLIEGFRALARMQVSIDASRERLESLLVGPDTLVRESAAERLAAHGKPALPALRHALHDDHPDRSRGSRIHVMVPGSRLVPLAASRAIARIDATDPDAIEGLLWFANHGLGHERLTAVTSLGNPALGQRWRVVHALVVIARSGDDRLAVEAIAALGGLGPSARWAIPTLEQLVADERSRRAAPAAAALERIRGR